MTFSRNGTAHYDRDLLESVLRDISVLRSSRIIFMLMVVLFLVENKGFGLSF